MNCWNVLFKVSSYTGILPEPSYLLQFCVNNHDQPLESRFDLFKLHAPVWPLLRLLRDHNKNKASCECLSSMAISNMLHRNRYRSFSKQNGVHHSITQSTKFEYEIFEIHIFLSTIEENFQIHVIEMQHEETDGACSRSPNHCVDFPPEEWCIYRSCST